MIEISLGKMVLLALIALIVLGPEKLPGAARTAGALLRRVRGGWDNVRAEVERELEIDQIKRAAREAAAQAEAAGNTLKDSVNELREPLAESAAEMAAMARPEAAVMTEIKHPGREPATVEPMPAEPAPESAPDSADADDRQAELPLDEATDEAPPPKPSTETRA